MSMAAASGAAGWDVLEHSEPSLGATQDASAPAAAPLGCDSRLDSPTAAPSLPLCNDSAAQQGKSDHCRPCSLPKQAVGTAGAVSGAVVVDVAATPSVRRARAALLAKTGHVDAAGIDNPGGDVVAGNGTAGADYESEEAALALVRGLQAGHALASLLDDGCGFGGVCVDVYGWLWVGQPADGTPIRPANAAAGTQYHEAARHVYSDLRPVGRANTVSVPRHELTN